MIGNLTITPTTRMTCVEPACLLKKDGFQAQNIAEFFIQTLAGESRESIVPGIKQIVARPQCISCALRVMQGIKAYRTEAEWNHLDDLGHWHHRRQWRKKYFGRLNN